MDFFKLNVNFWNDIVFPLLTTVIGILFSYFYYWIKVKKVNSTKTIENFMKKIDSEIEGGGDGFSRKATIFYNEHEDNYNKFYKFSGDLVTRLLEKEQEYNEDNEDNGKKWNAKSFNIKKEYFFYVNKIEK